MKLGIDCLLDNSDLLRELGGRRIAVLGHPASITAAGQHTIDALASRKELNVTAAFGPQHGMRGEKQDNMIESDDYLDPALNIPVFSLYGTVRRPTKKMMDSFDVLLVDLQDIGTRIYTFITTVGYMLEAAARDGKSVWVLDRPNPAGRQIEGTILEPGWESFIGIGPMIMRHGFTIGEFAKWWIAQKKLHLDFRLIEMQGYDPEAGPGYGWPAFELPWVNPSPNASSLNMTRCFPGTVLFEGTTLSEGRGTTNSLEIVGAPDVDFGRVLNRAQTIAPDWMSGCKIRLCYFEPTFQKHKEKLCSGVQVHTDFAGYRPAAFKPYRLGTLLLKAIRLEYPDYPIWHHNEYEYEKDRLAIDLLSGSSFLRDWVDNMTATPEDFDERLVSDESQWAQIRRDFLCYHAR